MNLGQFVKKCRQARNMTQMELAKAANLSQGSVSKLEKGISMPAFDVMARVAKTLKISLDDAGKITLRQH